MMIAAFAIQLFLTSRINRRWGIGLSLLILPVMSMLGGALFFALPFFWAGTAIKFVDGSLGFSIQNVSKELLYLPTARAVKYEAKAFIDIFFFRFGDALAALLLLLLGGLGMPVHFFSVMVMILAAVWVAMTLRMKGEYVALLSAAVKQPVLAAADFTQAVEDAAADLRPEDFPQQATVEGKIQEELRLYAMCLILRSRLAGFAQPNLRPLLERLEAKRLVVAKRLLRLISFMQPTEDLYHAFSHLIVDGHEKAALAVELLDNTMLGGIRRLVLPFFSAENSLREKVELAQRLFQVSDSDLLEFMALHMEETPAIASARSALAAQPFASAATV
jgi:hypothetical protein